MVLDPEKPFVHPAEREWSEVHLPEAISGFLEPDVLARERVGDAHSMVFPADPAVAADGADLEVAGVLDGEQGAGQGAGLLLQPRTHEGALQEPRCEEDVPRGDQVGSRPERGQHGLSPESKAVGDLAGPIPSV